MHSAFCVGVAVCNASFAGCGVKPLLFLSGHGSRTTRSWGGAFEPSWCLSTRPAPHGHACFLRIRFVPTLCSSVVVATRTAFALCQHIHRSMLLRLWWVCVRDSVLSVRVQGTHNAPHRRTAPPSSPHPPALPCPNPKSCVPRRGHVQEAPLLFYPWWALPCLLHTPNTQSRTPCP